MSSQNETQYYQLPQFADGDIPSWNDINTAFQKIDTALHSIASASGITEAQARSIVNESLVGAVFHDSTNGTGITSAQYSKLLIKNN